MNEDFLIEDFLNFLGERKYKYFHSLNIAKPQAYSKLECQQRLETMSKLDELLTIIDGLLIEQQKIVDIRFNELKG